MYRVAFLFLCAAQTRHGFDGYFLFPVTVACNLCFFTSPPNNLPGASEWNVCHRALLGDVLNLCSKTYLVRILHPSSGTADIVQDKQDLPTAFSQHHIEHDVSTRPPVHFRSLQAALMNLWGHIRFSPTHTCCPHPFKHSNLGQSEVD